MAHALIKTRGDKRRDFQRKQQLFQKSRKAEVDYARKLRSIAQQVGVIVNGFTHNGVVQNPNAVAVALRRYADIITPWAKAVASRMLADIARRDEDMWTQMGDEISRNLKREIEHAPTGLLMSEALQQQVTLITSLPLEAAQRVQDLTMLMLSDSTRSDELSAEIMRTGQVTKSRANLIARTEVARTATELTQARAKQAGVTHYIWRTSGDADVRESHRHMNGKTIAFNDPPEVEPGKRYHAGQVYNCRCYPEVIVPDEGP